MSRPQFGGQRKRCVLTVLIIGLLFALCVSAIGGCAPGSQQGASQDASQSAVASGAGDSSFASAANDASVGDNSAASSDGDTPGNSDSAAPADGDAPAGGDSTASATDGDAPDSSPAPVASDASASADASASIASSVDPATAFPSWNADSDSLQALVSFVAEATDETSDGYVPPEDRIATFDMDGTLISEKAPVYIDYCLMLYRVLEDPNYQADVEAIEACTVIRANADQGIIDNSLGDAKNQTFARVFEGMTPDEFRTYANEFFDTQDVKGFSGMTYGQTEYKPMAEIVDFLQANGFDVYIVTASEREVARAFAEERFGIQPSHVIGSDWETVATNQGAEAADAYTFAQDDELMLGDEVLTDCAKANKVIYIQREIGKCPVLAFGNSTGDFAMLNYAQSSDEQPGMGFLVIADDTEREYGDEEKAAQMREEVESEGWTGISMRNDWVTIYGEGVEKTQLPADGELAEAA